MRVQWTINGKAQSLALDDPDMPLVFVLRDLLGLTGTKYSCLEGLCGACTVHVDGVATRACQMRASQLDGRHITTIEGLSPDGSHPVQRAWVEQQVPQCGWCQPGQIMQAAAFVAQNQHASRQDVAEAMAGNLCRCGTGPRIVNAVVQVLARQRNLPAAS
jgi:isoquinoline 1-oxidoreductase alpha subunit